VRYGAAVGGEACDDAGVELHAQLRLARGAQLGHERGELLGVRRLDLLRVGVRGSQPRVRVRVRARVRVRVGVRVRVRMHRLDLAHRDATVQRPHHHEGADPHLRNIGRCREM